MFHAVPLLDLWIVILTFSCQTYLIFNVRGYNNLGLGVIKHFARSTQLSMAFIYAHINNCRHFNIN